MLTRIAELKHISRFAALDHPRSDDVRFRRLTLIYALNGSGKSTLADVLRAAARGDPSICEQRRRLRSIGPGETPSVTLLFEGGTQNYRHARWDACPHPIEVYDRSYIDENVFVGRAPKKEHRTRMLEVALGAEEVRWKEALDALRVNTLELNQRLRQVESVLNATAREHRMSLDDFVELPPDSDHVQAVSRAKGLWEGALRAKSLGQWPRYQSVKLPERRDLTRLRAFLTRDVAAIAEDAETAVREHISGRLGDDDKFVRRGLALMDGDTCPFCAQGAAGSSLIAHYRAVFDAKHQEFTAQLDMADQRLREQRDLVPAIRDAIRQNNESIAKGWSDAAIRPVSEQLDAGLGAHPELAMDRVLSVLDDHRRRLRGASARTEEALVAADAWNRFVDSAAEYNARVFEANTALDRWVAERAQLAPEDAESAHRRAVAAQVRHQPEFEALIQERAKILEERAKIGEDKKAQARMGSTATAQRLREFSGRLNRHLEDFGTRFRIQDLATERGAGKPALRFGVALGNAAVDIKDARGEEAFRHLLSDGDRSALAFALFVTDLEDRSDLAERIVVFDDPMTSMDVDRMRATAVILRRLSEQARQVIVLSHNAPFLADLNADLNADLDVDPPGVACVTLLRDSEEIAPWSPASAGRR